MQMSREMKKEEELKRVNLLQFVAIESLSPLQGGPQSISFITWAPGTGHIVGPDSFLWAPRKRT
jgi:hypothetical protein